MPDRLRCRPCLAVVDDREHVRRIDGEHVLAARPRLLERLLELR